MNEHPKYYITYMKFHDDAIHDSATVIHKEKMMNERIRELALLAHSDALESYRERMKTEFAGDVIFSDMYDQKFAELIVRECAEQSMSIGRYNTPSGVTPDLSIAIAVGLKKHFGVEE